jgi:hypothetical protein
MKAVAKLKVNPSMNLSLGECCYLIRSDIFPILVHTFANAKLKISIKTADLACFNQST